ncbi:signal peptidase I [Arthrobacter oryzae]|uniref:Signal peptidase I n=1 Tax=Arthrobacter oryzae TaxID=409290 RepID=A0A495EP38_9MICC|nr:signal peptidase I [Arthrobacter oryzae]RKR18725.1 signal peptidase I [Arthrobacter oryzae]
MPETEPRTPDPQGQNLPRVTSAAIPDEPQAEPSTARLPQARVEDGRASGAGVGTAGAGAGAAGSGAEPGAGTGTGTARARAAAAAPSAASGDEGAGALRADRAGGERHAGPAHAGRSPRRARKAKAREGHSPFFLWLKEVATVVVVAVVLSFLIKTFLFRAFYIPSESMVNTLDVNDRIFVNLLVPKPMALERGDVVVFKDSQGWLTPAAEKKKGPFTWVQDGLTFVGLLPDNSEQHLVKRVIGLPGDHVVCCDAGGQLTVNGAPLNEKYINPAEIPQVHDFDVVVPAGKVWVMGDNRNHSADSRAHMDTNGGFVNESDIEGRAAVIAWPLNRISALDNYPDVFRAVPAPAGK